MDSVQACINLPHFTAYISCFSTTYSLHRCIYCIPEVVDAGEVVLGVDVDDTSGVVVVTPKTHTQLLVIDSQCTVNIYRAGFCTDMYKLK